MARKIVRTRAFAGAENDVNPHFADPPPPRTRPLTPKLSATASADNPTAPPTSGMGLFDRLSPELQQAIVTWAFGDLIIHLELVPETDRRWHPRGFVCSRSPALGEARELRGPDQDLCLQNLAGVESLAKVPDGFQEGVEYQIGAMGWLQSCRQAYALGIYVLYSKNTFHIADGDLSSQLNLVMPTRLPDIRKVEMLWNVDRIRPNVTPGYQHVLDTFSQSLPNVQDVYVSFHCDLLSETWLEAQPVKGEAIEEALFPALDKMAGRLSPQCQITVALPMQLWIPLTPRARRAGATVEMKPHFQGRFWRPLSPVLEKSEHGGEGPSGYWVHSGWEGQMPSTVSCFRGTRQGGQ